ncbi:MAG: CDP-diacylglycerol--serine O-phosphatidyltransferase [Pseudomonadota bacterium]
MATEKPARPIHKGVYILPNLFTTASLFAGFLGLLWASAGQYEQCALAILFSALMDGLDGKVARLTNTASEFGVQYDSLCDLVAFGVVPAFLVWHWQLEPFGRLGIGAAFLLAACGALRLARFNISTATACKKFFTGLPIPAAGCALSCFVLFAPYVPDFFMGIMPYFTLLLTIMLALLMVSRVRYASFKEYGFIKAHPFSSMVSVILLFALIASEPKIFGFLLFMAYLISGLVYTFIILPRRTRKLLASPAQQGDLS